MLFLICFIISIFYLIFVLKNPLLIQLCVKDTTELFLKVIIPSIFPSFIISNILVNNKISIWIFNRINNKLKLFNSGYSLLIYFNSILVGNPTTSYLYIQGYKNNLITKEDIIKLVKTTNFINPLLLISILKDIKLALSIVLFFFIINTVYLIINKTKNIKNSNIDIKFNIFTTLNNVSNILLNILTIILFINIIKLPIKNDFITLFFEITTGLNNIICMNSSYKFLLSMLLINCNGLCIIIQTLNCFEDYNILKKEYLKSLFFKTVLLLIVI